MRAVMLADQMHPRGRRGCGYAGGMENMSRPPYLLLKAREGYRMGNSEVMDALMYDGLTDAYSNKPMGVFADQCALQVRNHPPATGRLRGREPCSCPQGRRRQDLR